MNESMVDESMVIESTVNKSKEIESQVNESMVKKSMVNKSRVNKSMVKVLLLPAPCSLLPAPAEWRTGTIPALLKAQAKAAGQPTRGYQKQPVRGIGAGGGYA